MNDDIKEDLKENLKQQSTWMRALYMLMFALLYSVTEFVLFAVVIIQFILMLLTGSTNPQLLKLGQNIATYIYQIIQYLTFNSEYQPYPVGDWPLDKQDSDAPGSAKQSSGKSARAKKQLDKTDDKD